MKEHLTMIPSAPSAAATAAVGSTSSLLMCTTVSITFDIDETQGMGFSDSPGIGDGAKGGEGMGDDFVGQPLETSVAESEEMQPEGVGVKKQEMHSLIAVALLDGVVAAAAAEAASASNVAADIIEISKSNNQTIINLEILHEFFESDITVFVDQEHFVVEVRTLMLEFFAAYLVVRDLVAVATVQAECESVVLIAVVNSVAGTAVHEVATNLMYFVVIVAALEPLVVAACVQSDDLFVQANVAAVIQAHYFPIVVDVNLLGCFADLLTVAVAVVETADVAGAD
ncbi:hypothetical protein CR513_62317, partial [Mucuna pruriens]